MPKKTLSPKAISILEKDLKKTRGFALPGKIHNKIDNVLNSFLPEDIEELFEEHKQVLISLNVTSLSELLEIK